jgi:parallel beta-helix repeat protein
MTSMPLERAIGRGARAFLLTAAVLLPQLPSAGPVMKASAETLLHPGDDVAGIVAAAPEGTSFRFAAGIYRLLDISPKSHDSFAGEPGTVLSGAQAVTGFAPEEGLFVAAVTLAQGQLHGSCAPGRHCELPNDVFIANQRQEPVLRKEDVRPGGFFIDFAAHKLYLGSNPAAKLVELSTARRAFFGGKAEDVHISGLVIEKYAIPAQMGAVGDQSRPKGWAIENCELRYNHGAGVIVGDDSRISHCFIHHNGQLGISASGSNLLIEDNELAANSQAGFNPNWEVGGMKFTRSSHAVIRGNYAHDNHGPGIWADIDDIETLYEGNRLENNDNPGIQHEISYKAVIRNNIARGNGAAAHSWGWGAQILVQNSRDVDVTGNRVAVAAGGNGITLVEQQRGQGAYGPHVVANCRIHDNLIAMAGPHGLAVAALTDYAASNMAGAGNSFDSDHFYVVGVGTRNWDWPMLPGPVTFQEFQSRLGQERHGTVTIGPPPF